MGLTNFRIDVTTDASGNATAYSQGGVSGEIEYLRYTPDGSTPLDTGAGITVTGDASAVPIVAKTSIGTSAFNLAPRMAVNAVADGSALTFDGTHPVVAKIALAGERIKVVVASGGNTKSGSFAVIVKN